MEEQKTASSEITKMLINPDFQKTLASLVPQTGDSLQAVHKQAEEYLTELYSEHQPLSNVVMMEAAQYILSRGYDKTIDVKSEDMKKLTKLMRTNSVAFVLTHKSYVDLLVLSLVLARHGLPLPFMFAGINLDLYGIGKFARKAGVIYIRRSFKDNLIYKATLRHFIASFLDKQSHFMWALEGTRSRTGKLVWPQMGILKYILEAEEHSTQSVKYVPVSIVYDLIPDVAEMTKEGRGKKKNPENLAWLMNYVRKMSGNLGRISLRIGDPIDTSSLHNAPIPDDEDSKPSSNNAISHFAFELVHRINAITPVTTTSLICTSLLSKFALTKRGVESDIADLMQLIESHKRDALVDRGRPIGESVQVALNMLTEAKLFLQQGDSLNAKFTIMRENYLSATYYANMAVHHLYHRAFIELALIRIADLPAEERMMAFWTEIMLLRDMFKFEFFYSRKPQFTEEIEADLDFIDTNWQTNIMESDSDIPALLEKQKILVAPVLLFNYIEAYRVVAHGLQIWDIHHEWNEKKFMDSCLFLGEEMHWQGRIRRIEAVSKPFLLNGILLAKNLKLIPTESDPKKTEIAHFIQQLDAVAQHINKLQGIILAQPFEDLPSVPLERELVPGSRTESITTEIMAGESGAHIGAFFDLDKTLIKGFSAKDFMKERILSGKFTTKEVVAQFAGVISFATDNGNFASMAAIGAKGVQGVKEQVFIEVGEEVYHKHLAAAIYPEARELVAAHIAKGHTVAIISAATPYQVEPIARDFGIAHVMCTRMEVKNGIFTGDILQPACWGEGKAHAGRKFAGEYKLDLSKSFFYTDSAEDLPLLEIVGNPRPTNPDAKLSGLAFKNDWPVYRFDDDEPSQVTNVLRTGLAATVFIPAFLQGVTKGIMNMSFDDGIDSMMAGVGDFGTAAAGIQLAVKGEEHLWANRPCVFIFNHQSSADFLIAAKLIRKQARAIAKKELENLPILGQMLKASGTIFLDRTDKEKSIEAMKPAVDSLKNGTSVIIFPEGTRSYDYTLGKFKKGAFHLAMQAGVPLVPVIIKNAHDAMPRGTSIFKPSAIEVVVLPAIDVKDWTLENLSERIQDVRGLFLKELGQTE